MNLAWHAPCLTRSEGQWRWVEDACSCVEKIPMYGNESGNEKQQLRSLRLC